RPAHRVVNTHHNGDHCWGNQLFARAEIIGHRLCAASFGKERPELMQTLRNAAGSVDPRLREMARHLAAWDFAGRTLTLPPTLVAAKRGFDAGLPALEAARRIDLGPYAGWTEPERILFQVERAYRELRGEPWDAPIDVTALFRSMHALRESRRAVA